MANFIVNSTRTKAIRKEYVMAVEIVEEEDSSVPPITTYELKVQPNVGHRNILRFETDETLEGIQAKAASVLSELEARKET